MPKQSAIRDMRTFFENPFDDERITDDRMKKFSEDHLARLANNPVPAPVGTQLISDTLAKHNAYFGAIAAEDLSAALRQSLTAGVDAKLQLFKDLVKKRQRAIQGAFTDDPTQAEAFFPQGLKEYTEAAKENVETLMERYTDLLTQHAAVLPPAIATEIAPVITDYKALRASQLAKKGAVADNKDTTAANRDALEKQLWRNVHYLAYHYDGDVEQCMAYFDQSFLRGTTTTTEPGAPGTPDDNGGGGTDQ